MTKFSGSAPDHHKQLTNDLSSMNVIDSLIMLLAGSFLLFALHACMLLLVVCCGVDASAENNRRPVNENELAHGTRKLPRWGTDVAVSCEQAKLP